MAHDYKEHEKTFLQESPEFLSRMARYYMLDMIRATMHNEGYALEGNTEESDHRWLARWIYQQDGDRHHWDQVPEDVRERYLKLAQILMEAIPHLMSRISSRCIAISQAVNTTIKAEKLHEWYEQQEKHPARRMRG
jgi:hypothetical protein